MNRLKMIQICPRFTEPPIMGGFLLTVDRGAV